MPQPIIMPKFGFTQEESTIVAWLKQAGDTVEKGEPICEVTTDKVDMEIESPGDGILAGLRCAPGDTVPVTTVIATLLAPGESLPETDAESAATPLARRIAAAEGVDLAKVAGSGPRGRITRHDVERRIAAPQDTSDGGRRVRATPAARRVVREHGLALAEISGSGPRGRVQAADALAAVPAAPPSPRREPVRVPLEGMRRTIAERMQRSAQQAPHITLTLDVDMSKALALRDYAGKRETEGMRLSLTALIVKAAAWALSEHPALNAYLVDDAILLLPEINVGVAVALEEGLIVPVIRDADRKGLRTIDAELTALATRARAGELAAQDVADGTFTVSNLGMFGIDRFTAILNPPQVGILAVGRVATRFVPDAEGRPLAHPLMTLTLSADHRAVDGAVAARFLSALQGALEEPARILL